MYVLRLHCRVAERDTLVAELHELGTLGILETELPDFVLSLDAWFDQPFDSDSLARHDPAWEQAPERDWIAESRRGWEPLAVGERLHLVPEWLDDPAPPGRVRLTVHPGAASGSGYSEATQLALEALERTVHADDAVLDIGTGSGILTAAAWLLGARRLFACDIDDTAARTAASNLAGDSIRAAIFAGSPRSIRTGAITLAVANLNAASLLANAAELTRVLAADGRLIVSGFRERRLRDVRRAFESRGLPVRAETRRDDWRCLVLSG